MHSTNVERIRESLAPGLERDLFAAAVRNLCDSNNPLRFNNFAYAARETVRHVLERLAPSERVVKCSWYKNVTDKPNGISRGQRACYAVQGGLGDEFVRDSLSLDTEDIHKSLKSAIDNLSKFTHVEQAVFALPAADVDKFVDETLSAVTRVLDTIDECRKRIVDRFAEQLDSATVDAALSDSLVGVDQLASHFSLQEVYVDSVKVIAIDEHFVHMEARGKLDCILQYGSNSDIRRGDGAEIPQSFEFTCGLEAPVDDPTEIAAVEDSLGVDTTAFERDRYGLDEYDETK